jgi:tetratricopeptide (TPR) repeat protein/transcriptional regulator with XRE-family HTH domain
MESFSELLSTFAERTGISDAELARRTGVSRQTIFRWKEGRSRGPRHRDIVLQLANALQVSEPERDALLLAAGFPPVGNQVELDLGAHSVGSSSPFWKRPATMLVAAMLLVLLIGGSVLILVESSLVSNLFAPSPRRAAEGETLILVSEFSNYANEQIGFNVAGRLTEAIRDELDDSISADLRVEKLGEVITTESLAQDLGAEYGATLVIWGEYDSGRVIVHSTVPYLDLQTSARGREWFISSTEELTTVINSKLTQEIRWEVLHILGQTYYLAGESETAEGLFKRAVQVQTEDETNRGLAYFFLGLIESQRDAPDLDSVIAYYSEAVTLRPKLVSALNNRAIAYLERNAPGDLVRARDDFKLAVELAPSLYAATHNLAVTLFNMDPGSPEESIELLEQAAQLDPESPASPHAICWYHTYDGHPEEALPYCEQAVSLDPSGVYLESLAVTHAKLGEYEKAITELEAYLEYLRSNSQQEFEDESSLVNSWIDKLRAHVDPFDRETILAILR